MPRVQSSTEQIKDRLSSIERNLRPISHFFTLVKALYWARTARTYLLLLEFLIPLAFTLFSVFFVRLSETGDEPLFDLAGAYEANGSALQNRQLLVQTPSALTNTILPIESILNQTVKDCKLRRWDMVKNLWLNLVRSGNGVSLKDHHLPLGVHFSLKYDKFNKEHQFHILSPFDYRLDIFLHVPTFAQSTQPFFYHVPDPPYTDHVRDFRFGLYQSGYLTLQRCVLESVNKYLSMDNFKEEEIDYDDSISVSQARPVGNASKRIRASPKAEPPIDWSRIQFQPIYTHNEMTSLELMLDWFTPQMVALGWLMTSLMMGTEIITENSRSTRSLMRIFGVQTSVYWITHLSFNFFIMLLHSLFTVGMLEIWFLIFSEEQIKMTSFSPAGYLHNFILFTHQTPSYLLLQTLIAYSAMQCSFCALNTLLWRRHKAFVCFNVALTLFSVHLPQILLDTHLNPKYASVSLQSTPQNQSYLPHLLLWFTLMLPNACLRLALQMIGELSLVNRNAQIIDTETMTSTSMRFNNLVLATLWKHMLMKALVYVLITIMIDQEYYWFCEWISFFRQKMLSPKKAPTNLTAQICVTNLSQRGNILFNAPPTLRNVTFQVPNGQIMAVITVQSSSRLSLIETLAGLNEFRSSGRIKLAGYDLSGQTTLARQSAGFCFQRNGFYPWLTVQQNLEVFCSFKFAHTRRALAEANLLAHVLQLNDLKKRLAITLNSSIGRRLALSLALTGGSRALIIDQPTARLDGDERAFVWQLLAKMRSFERSILIGTNDFDEAAKVADQMLLISDGQVIYCGRIQQFLETYRVGHQLIIGKRAHFKWDVFEKMCSDFFTNDQVQLHQIGAHQLMLIVKLHAFNAAEALANHIKTNEEALGFNLINFHTVTSSQAMERLLLEARSLECESTVTTSLMAQAAGVFAITDSITPASPSAPSPMISLPTPTDSTVNPAVSTWEQLRIYSLNTLDKALSRFHNLYLLSALILMLLLMIGPITWHLSAFVQAPVTVYVERLNWETNSKTMLSLVVSKHSTWMNNRKVQWYFLTRSSSGNKTSKAKNKLRFSVLQLTERLARAIRLVHPSEVALITNKEMTKMFQNLFIKHEMYLFALLLIPDKLPKPAPPTKLKKKPNKEAVSTVPSTTKKATTPTTTKTTTTTTTTTAKTITTTTTTTTTITTTTLATTLTTTLTTTLAPNFSKIQPSLLPKNRTARSINGKLASLLHPRNPETILQPFWLHYWMQDSNQLGNTVKWPRDPIMRSGYITDIASSKGKTNTSTFRLVVLYNANAPMIVTQVQDAIFNSLMQMPHIILSNFNPRIRVQSIPLVKNPKGFQEMFTPIVYRPMLSLYVCSLLCYVGFVCNSPFLFLAKNQNQVDKVDSKALLLSISNWKNFWIANFVFDFIIYILSLVIVCSTHVVLFGISLLDLQPIIISSLVTAFTIIPLQYILSLCARTFMDYFQQILLLHLINMLIPALIWDCVQINLFRWYTATGLAYDWFRSFVYMLKFCSPAFSLVDSVQKNEALRSQRRFCSQIESKFLNEICPTMPSNFSADVFVPFSENRIYQCCNESYQKGVQNVMNFGDFGILEGMIITFMQGIVFWIILLYVINRAYNWTEKAARQRVSWSSSFE